MSSVFKGARVLERGYVFFAKLLFSVGDLRNFSK